MPTKIARLLAVLLAFMLVAAACGGDDDDGDGDGDDASGETETDGDGSGEAEEIDYEAIGLWDDGPCDESLEPLHVGMMTAFETPVLSLEDQAFALEAAATAFNERGGANGACIEVTTCDDQATLDQAVSCVRDIDEAGVHATINDQGSIGQAEVSQAMADAGIPRIASNVTQDDWDDENAYPLDASGTGVTFLMPQALLDQGITQQGLIRVDLAEFSVFVDLLGGLYPEVDIVADIPVPAGTTDYSQFILGAEDRGAEGVSLPLGEQEAVQVINAAQQLGTDLPIGSSLGSFSHSSVAGFGDFADQMIFVWSFAPATFDIPVYDALRADLAASGEDSLQPENLKASPMRSWIGLYATLEMIRDQNVTEFTRENMTAMLRAAEDVPMLDMFGGADWTPDRNSEGLWSRAGIDTWSTYRWDPAASFNGESGNFVRDGEISFDAVLCGSPFGPPEPC
ncbi:MAG: ABC transporter substrate-binding protein [Acidimicrobiales bacterium]|nr:ABC transporter substrate-binding protein [Acidimicrobiales bacterium]